jgi:hypothetical protein
MIHAQSDSSLLKLEKEIPLLGIEGRVDHFSVDVQGKRLFVAALGNGTIEVLDVTKGERTGEIRAALRRTVLELSPRGQARALQGLQRRYQARCPRFQSRLGPFAPKKAPEGAPNVLFVLYYLAVIASI